MDISLRCCFVETFSAVCTNIPIACLLITQRESKAADLTHQPTAKLTQRRYTERHYLHPAHHTYWCLRNRYAIESEWGKVASYEERRWSGHNSTHVFRRVSKIAKSDCYLRHVCTSVCPSVRTKQLGSHRMDFYEISYMSIFRKCVEKMKVSLKSDPNNKALYMKTDQYASMIIISSSSSRIRMFQRQLWRKSKQTYCVQ